MVAKECFKCDYISTASISNVNKVLIFRTSMFTLVLLLDKVKI